jgi:hypothetical protein
MKNISLLIAWVATFGLAAALIHEKSKPEKVREVLNEVVREVPREVVREVEVIREVPREVIREVEVVKEVERALTIEEKTFMKIGQDFVKAEVQTTSEGTLKGIEPVSIQVRGNEAAYKILSKEKMLDIFELSLRGNGIRISKESSFVVFCDLEVVWDDDNIRATFTIRTYVTTAVGFFVPSGEIRATSAVIDGRGKFGFAGSNVVADTLADGLKAEGDAIALRLLRARDHK